MSLLENRFMEILGAFCLFALAVHTVGLAVAAWRTTREPDPDRARPKPAVTILRPVCGLENNVRETLASTFRLRHPKIEILFCVASHSDPVIPLVRELIDAHPAASARLLVGDDRVSVNPKLNNLIKGWKAASHDWIFMVDSNVLMPTDFVDRCLDRWTPGTGLVCSPPVGQAPESMGAEIECAWLNAFQARWQLVADTVGLGFAQGKVMLWRREILENAGGIERLAGEVAEDAAATKIVRAAGLKVRLVDRPFPQPLGRRRLGEVWKRQLRWARLRRASFPLFFAPEILAGGALPCLGAVLLGLEGAWSGPAVAGFVAAWYLIEHAAARTARWTASIGSLPAAVARDLALPALWVAALLGNGFEWRGNDMAVPKPKLALRRKA